MTEEEITKLKRRLKMEQLSYGSDLKKVQRNQLTLKDDMRRFKQERDRINVTIKEKEDEEKKLLEKEDFMSEELHRIKKQLIELG
ncbi:MAG: hypothetical protein ABFQ53_00295 [Patescibacteria group bacterium]